MPARVTRSYDSVPMPNVAPVTSTTILSGSRSVKSVTSTGPSTPITTSDRSLVGTTLSEITEAAGVGVGVSELRSQRELRTATVGRPAAPGVALAGRAGIALAVSG